MDPRGDVGWTQKRAYQEIRPIEPVMDINQMAPQLIGQSLWSGWLMFWATLWPLVLGFCLSGLVQACASRNAMERVMGSHKPGAILRASGLGMVSSSCSYAASAMSKNLFARGADFITAQVFMMASTNLVLELGLVLIVLLGWQFAAAEFIGGPLMIILLAWWGTLLFPVRLTRPAQERLRESALANGADAGSSKPERLGSRLRSPATWANAASYALADLTMLRKELLIGFVVAGMLSALVPDTLWRIVFMQNQGIWTSIQNALIAPLIAIISFVCSVGNVAMAAALWTGGVSFGGVIAFIFADLITLPLLLIYRKYYGPRLALRMLLGLWLLMSFSGLVVEGLFRVSGLIPETRINAGQTLSIGWNSTTWLNLVALSVLLMAWWLAHNKERFGGGAGYALDPICGMQVEKANAPATRQRNGEQFWFCSDHCAEHFDQQGEQPTGHSEISQENCSEVSNPGRDPICGMDVNPEKPGSRREHAEEMILFCSTRCAKHFDEEPAKYVKESTDPICGMTVHIKPSTPHRQKGQMHAWFCSTRCAETFDARA